MKLRKLLIAIILIILPFIFISCTKTKEEESSLIALPDLTDMSRVEIEAKMKEVGLEFYFGFSAVPCYNDSYYDKFVEYSGGLEIGDLVEKDKVLTILTTPLHFTKIDTSHITLDIDYVGKSFIDDGIGEVTLVRSVDGDTARFIDPYSETVKTDFSVRFLGIDTPESTRENEPWGKAASTYTASILNNATTIVLEAEGARTETYGRYLAFVWVDGVLLNLEIVQEAYSHSALSSKSKYFQVMLDASFAAKKTGRRIYGERDTTYKY